MKLCKRDWRGCGIQGAGWAGAEWFFGAQRRSLVGDGWNCRYDLAPPHFRWSSSFSQLCNSDAFAPERGRVYAAPIYIRRPESGIFHRATIFFMIYLCIGLVRKPGQEPDLALHRKGEPNKLEIAVRLGKEIGRASCGKECRSRWSPYH